MYDRTFDGEEHFLTGSGFQEQGRTEIDQSVDESTWKITMKRNAQIIGVRSYAVSSDGKILTERRVRPTEQILVFQKQ